MIKILAIGAHPDDIELRMFGTLFLEKEKGVILKAVVVTDGSKGGEKPGLELKLQRVVEAIKGLRPLEIEPEFLEFVDGELCVDESLTQALLKCINEFTPDIVMTHSSTDYHNDHSVVSKVVSEIVKGKCAFLSVKPFNGGVFYPTHFFDISCAVDVKEEAVLKHKSQNPGNFIKLLRDENYEWCSNNEDSIQKVLELFELGACNKDFNGLLELLGFKKLG